MVRALLALLATAADAGILTFTPWHKMSLPDWSDATSNDAASALEDVGLGKLAEVHSDVMVMSEKFPFSTSLSLGLQHKHWDINSDEVLVMHSDASTLRPVKMDAARNVTPVSFSLQNGTWHAYEYILENPKVAEVYDQLHDSHDFLDALKDILHEHHVVDSVGLHIQTMDGVMTEVACADGDRCRERKASTSYDLEHPDSVQFRMHPPRGGGRGILSAPPASSDLEEWKFFWTASCCSTEYGR